MQKKAAKNIVDLLDKSSDFANTKFVIEEILEGDYLEDFHQWADFKSHLGSFLIRKEDDKTALWFVFNQWNPNHGYYLIVFPENRKGPLIEIQKKDDEDLKWRYKPSKRDGKNSERKEYFREYFGDVEVTVSVPKNTWEVVDFIEDIFQLTDVRVKSDELSEDLPPQRDVFKEGRRIERKHYARERNSKLITFVKNAFKEKNGTLFCEVCGFDFEEKYGERGKDFIEAHHTRPLSELDISGEETKPEEIILVCSNCHRMIHKIRPWLSIEEIQKILIK